MLRPGKHQPWHGVTRSLSERRQDALIAAYSALCSCAVVATLDHHTNLARFYARKARGLVEVFAQRPPFADAPRRRPARASAGQAVAC